MRRLGILLISFALAAVALPMPVAQAEPEPILTFASFNVCKVGCGDAQGLPWDVRRDRVGRVITESGADVVGLQEATNNGTPWAKTQVLDIANLIAPAGYILVEFADTANACRRPRDNNGQLAGPSPCENTAALFYRASTVKQIASPNGAPTAGIAQLGELGAGQGPRSAYRSVMWGYLQPVAGGTPFLAISLHTDTDKDPVAEVSRVAIGQGLSAWVDAMNASVGLPGTPAVLTADLNSFHKRQPSGIQTQLTNSGWTDAFDAPTKINVRYSTVNHSKKYGIGGFPPAPRLQKITKRNPLGAAPRIDYIMSKGAISPVSYETVMYLNGRAFNPDYQASDHQMVKAVLRFG